MTDQVLNLCLDFWRYGWGLFILKQQLNRFFSLAPSKNGYQHWNRVEPNKRPRSSMSPTMLVQMKKENLELIIGSAGGAVAFLD